MFYLYFKYMLLVLYIGIYLYKMEKGLILVSSKLYLNDLKYI